MSDEAILAALLETRPAGRVNKRTTRFVSVAQADGSVTTSTIHEWEVGVPTLVGDPDHLDDAIWQAATSSTVVNGDDPGTASSARGGYLGRRHPRFADPDRIAAAKAFTESNESVIADNASRFAAIVAAADAVGERR